MKHALVLSGGAAYGAWQLGYVEGLLSLYTKDGRVFEPDIYVGTSVGGLMAAALAQFPEISQGLDWYGDLWGRRVRKSSDIYRTWWWKWLGPLAYIPSGRKGSIYTAEPLRRMIQKEFDPQAIQKSGKELYLSTVNMRTGSLVYRASPSGRASSINSWKPIYATAAYPIVFEPITITQGVETDGGLREFTPLARAIASGADRIDVVTTARERTGPDSWDDSKGILRIANRAQRLVALMMDEIIENDLRVCSTINRAVAAGTDLKHRRVSLNVHRPIEPMTGDSLDFSRDVWMKNRRKGYAAAIQWMKQLKAAGVESSDVSDY